MTMTEFFRDSLTRIDQVLQEDFEITDARTVPEVSDLTFGSTGKLIETSVLFVDLRSSSDLTQSHRRSTVAKIHRCFLNEMVRVARYWNGKVRGFAGDRIMVLLDATDDSADKAEAQTRTDRNTHASA